MSEESFFNYLVMGWFILAFIIFIALLFFTAPYGRYTRSNWGPIFGGRIGWL